MFASLWADLRGVYYQFQTIDRKITTDDQKVLPEYHLIILINQLKQPLGISDVPTPDRYRYTKKQ